MSHVPVLVGGRMDLISLKLSYFGCFGPNLGLNMSKLDLLEVFRSHVALY